jgi:hypothetical protein
VRTMRKGLGNETERSVGDEKGFQVLDASCGPVSAGVHPKDCTDLETKSTAQNLTDKKP